MLGKRSTLQPSTSSRNLFGGGSSSTTASTNPFGGGSSKPANPFGGGGTSSTPSFTSQPAFAGSSAGYSIPESNIYYLSSNNPHRYSKLSSLNDNVKNGFYFIENKFENNERYMEAFNKADSSKDMSELKDQTNEAVKAVKGAWNSLSSINHQVKGLQEELENNQRVADEMCLILKHIKNGDMEFDIPSSYFSNLLGQFETRLSQYKKRIDEMEEIIKGSLEKESQKQKMMQDDDFSFGEEGQGDAANSSLLYQVLQLLYNNFCLVANQVESVNEMVETKELKMKKFLERNTTMTLGDIESLFEYKESESDAMIKNLNALAVKNNERSALKSFDGLSLDDKRNDTRLMSRKRKTYATNLMFQQEQVNIDPYEIHDSRKRKRDSFGTSYTPNLDDYDGAHYRSKRRNDYGVRGISSERRYY